MFCGSGPLRRLHAVWLVEIPLSKTFAVMAIVHHEANGVKGKAAPRGR